MAELLGSYKNAYKKCWNVEVPDVLGWLCGIFFPTQSYISLIKGFLALLETLPLLGKENIQLWLLSLDKHRIIHV